MPSSDSYYRYVNVLHYLFEPEELKTAPIETLLAAPHFYNYTPYLFEAKTPLDRAYRQSLDQRMRLVRMPVRVEERIGGERHGPVTMLVNFVPGRRTYVEPLLSVGPRYDGEVFFVHFLEDDLVRFGFFSSGFAVFFSEALRIDFGRDYAIELFSSSLCRPPEEPAADSAEWWARAHPFMAIRCDGQLLLERPIRAKRVVPEQVYAAVNAVQTDYAISQFSGNVRAVNRSGKPPVTVDSCIGEILSPVPARLALEADFAGLAVGQAEPVAVVGKTGNAMQVFARRVDARRVTLGIEWGGGVRESDPLPISPEGHEIEIDLAALAASPATGGTIRVRLDQSPVVEFAVRPGMGISADRMTLGVNYEGGALVQPQFNGRIQRFRVLPVQPEDTALRNGATVSPLPTRLKLEVAFTGLTTGDPEPLLVCGKPGNALFVFVRHADDERIHLGIEWWGIGARESAPITVGKGAHTVTIDLTAVSEPDNPNRTVCVEVDGDPVVDFPVPPNRTMAATEVKLGVNEVGGSLVRPMFHGRILRVLEPHP